MRNRRRRNPDEPCRIYTNRVPGCMCVACNQPIALGEQKTWARITGRKANYHMPCAERLGVLVKRGEEWFRPTGEKAPVMDETFVPPAPDAPFGPGPEDFAPDTEREDDVDVDVPEVTPQPEPAPAPTPVNGKVPDWLQGMADAILPYVEQKIDAKVDKAQIQTIVEKAVEKARFPHVTVVEVHDKVRDTVTNVGTQHKMFSKVLSAVQAYGRSGKRNMVMLVGPTGSGKTTLAEKVAEVLKVPYYHFGAMDSEYKMTGFVDAQSRIVSTQFRKWYTETGGLALFDEMDSWFPNAQLSLNSLSNGYVSFPDGLQQGVPNRYLLAACNTWGFGADTDYVGRFKLDAAFLNRWNVKLHVDYDEDLERAIFGADRWTRRVQELRSRARAKGIKVIISPRASDTGYGLLEDGWPIEDVEEAVIRQGMKDSDWQSILLPRCA